MVGYIKCHCIQPPLRRSLLQVRQGLLRRAPGIQSRATLAHKQRKIRKRMSTRVYACAEQYCSWHVACRRNNAGGRCLRNVVALLAAYAFTLSQLSTAVCSRRLVKWRTKSVLVEEDKLAAADLKRERHLSKLGLRWRISAGLHAQTVFRLFTRR